MPRVCCPVQMLSTETWVDGAANSRSLAWNGGLALRSRVTADGNILPFETESVSSFVMSSPFLLPTLPGTFRPKCVDCCVDDV